MSSLKLTEVKNLQSMVEYFALLAEIKHHEVDGESFYGNVSELHVCTLLFSVWKLKGCSGSGRETVFTRKQAFQEIQGLHRTLNDNKDISNVETDATGADKEYVKFSGHVVKFYGALSGHKFLQWLRTGKRVLLITNAALYNLKGENFNCHRRLPLSKITSIIRSYLRHQVVIKIKRIHNHLLPVLRVSSILWQFRLHSRSSKLKNSTNAMITRGEEKVRRYLSEEVCEICDSIRSAQAIKCRAACPIKYQKKQDLHTFVVRMAQHALNLIKSKENKAQMERAIDDAAVLSERIETLDAEAVISEYLRRANAKPYGS